MTVDIRRVLPVRAMLLETLRSTPLAFKDRQKISIEVDESFEVYARLLAMRIIFYNLYTNAERNTLKGREDGRLRIFAEETGLHFLDNGNAMPRSKMPRKFDSHDNDREWVRFGLFFCRHTMEDLGGSIECKPVEGAGADFILHFPHVVQPPKPLLEDT